jgi:hypothetical protein
MSTVIFTFISKKHIQMGAVLSLVGGSELESEPTGVRARVVQKLVQTCSCCLPHNKHRDWLKKRALCVAKPELTKRELVQGLVQREFSLQTLDNLFI